MAYKCISIFDESMYLPLFMFEPTGICFALFTLVLTVCFAITWCMDRLKISPWFFGQNKMLKA